MARIDLFLVRHGEAAAGYAEHRDPGLSPLGAEQAALAAQRLTALRATRRGERGVDGQWHRERGGSPSTLRTQSTLGTLSALSTLRTLRP